MTHRKSDSSCTKCRFSIIRSSPRHEILIGFCSVHRSFQHSQLFHR
jgi:hypothetical protein